MFLIRFISLEVLSLYSNFLFFINYWLPWFSFLIEVFFLQLVCLYIVYLFIISDNSYYLLLFLVILTFFLGIFLALYQLELFTAFLWLVELSVFFVFLLLLFYINVKGALGFYKINQYYYIIFLIFSFCFFYSFYESDCLDTHNLLFYGDDFYSAYATGVCNDFYGLFISYYYVNFIEFIVIGLILLVGSLFCITLYNINSNITRNNYTQFFKIFSFFKDFVNFFFLRKQNLTRQGFSKETLKVFKKK